MSDVSASAWTAGDAWAGLPRTATDRGAEAAGVVLTLRGTPGLATLIVQSGGEPDLARYVAERFRVALPEPSRARFEGEPGLVWSGPGQWLAVGLDPDRIRGLAGDLAGIAAVTDQSAARAVVRVAGPRARDALAKGVTLDLHPQVFRAGHAAVTDIAHVGAQIWRATEDLAYEVAVPRSLAGYFGAWLVRAAGEFACAITQ